MPRFIPARLPSKKVDGGVGGWLGCARSRGEVTVGGGVVAEAGRCPAGDGRVLIA